MNDGRLFTNYFPEGMYHKNLQNRNSIPNNEEYREFLIHNATQIMDINRKQYQAQTSKYTPNNDPNNLMLKLPRTNNIPHLYHTANDENHKFGYESNETKEQYLSRENLNLKRINRLKL